MARDLSITDRNHGSALPINVAASAPGSLVVKPQASAALDALRAACGPLAVASPFARPIDDEAPAAPPSPPDLTMAGERGRRTAKS